MSDYYLLNWENYWASVKESGYLAPWDIVSPESIEEDIALIKSYFQQASIVVDLGCGSGIESKALSKHFNQVIGVDVSQVVINQINSNQNPQNTYFEQLDILNKQQVDNFISRFGHANIYLRGVLQQIKIADRSKFRQHIKLLMGTGNHLYFKEINPAAKQYFRKVIFEKKKIPPHIHRVLVQQVTKLVGVSVSDIEQIFPEPSFSKIMVDHSYIELYFDQETILHVPATHGIIKS